MITPIGHETIPYCFNELVIRSLQPQAQIDLRIFEGKQLNKARKPQPVEEINPKARYEPAHRDASRHIDLTA